MKDKVRKLLPIGSVVRLKKTELDFVIMAYFQEATAKADGNVVRYDYAGVPYPYGYVGKDTFVCFQDENIDKVVYRGYEDNTRLLFIDKLEAAERDAGDEELHILENL